jgi:hypothetical protein
MLQVRAEFATQTCGLSNFRTANNHEKFRKICKAIFSEHYNIFNRPNSRILLLLKGLFSNFFFRLDLSR